MDDESSRLRWVGRVAAALLGLVLLVAAWAKVIDPTSFAEQIAHEGLDFLLPAGAMAVIAIGLEIGLGVALLLGLRQLWVLLPTGLLVALFLTLTGRAYWLSAHGLLDDTAACGCFGNLVERTPAQAFWQDLALLIPLYLLSWWVRRRGEGWTVPRLRTAAVIVAVLAGTLFAWRAPSLPLDDLATRLKPGVRIEEICAGGANDASSICLDLLVPGLAEGAHWVVITELGNETFLAGLESLNELAIDGMDERLWVLSADLPAEHQTFFWQHGPAFEVREVPLAMIRPLYRSTPRSFRLEGGRVTETVSGLPPAAAPIIETRS